MEGARIYAENAIREKNQSLYLRPSLCTFCLLARLLTLNSARVGWGRW
jgi:hypothetical protein